MATYILACSTAEPPANGGMCPAGSAHWVTVEQTVDFAALGITPEAIVQVWAWGFGSVLTVWVLAIGIRAVVDAIRRA